MGFHATRYEAQEMGNEVGCFGGAGFGPVPRAATGLTALSAELKKF
jgi:hypothetical protein